MQLKRAFVVLLLFVSPAFAQWHPQKSKTKASLHGLSIVNGDVVWVSGTGGTFVRTTDGGTTWQAGTVTGAEKLDFRDVHAIDGETAYLLSIGKGNERIYKTTDAGKNWLLQYTEHNPGRVQRNRDALWPRPPLSRRPPSSIVDSSSSASTWNGKAASSEFLHKQLDVSHLVGESVQIGFFLIRFWPKGRPVNEAGLRQSVRELR